MKLVLSKRITVGASFIPGLSVPTPFCQQARTSFGGSASPVAAFLVEETTIAHLQAAYLAGKTTTREVTQAYINRITAYDKRGPYLNSIVNLNDLHSPTPTSWTRRSRPQAN